MRSGLIGFFVLLLMSGCKKDDPPAHGFTCDNITRTPVSNTDLLRCKYKVNSFWVYKDSLSGASDTVKVSSAYSWYWFVPPYTAGCDSVEHYTIKYSSADLLGYKGYSTISLDVIPDRLLLEAWDSKKAEAVIYAPQKQAGFSYSFFDSLSVLNTWYRNVYQSDTLILDQDLHNGLPGIPKTIYYFTINEGIIRQDFFNGKGQLTNRRSLQSYHIIL